MADPAQHKRETAPGLDYAWPSGPVTPWRRHMFLCFCQLALAPLLGPYPQAYTASKLRSPRRSPGRLDHRPVHIVAPPQPCALTINNAYELGRKTRSAFFTPILASAFFTRSLRVLYAFFTWHKTVDLGKNMWCGAARRSHLVVVRVWKFGSLPSLVFHARRATAEPYRSTPRPQKARASMGVVLRLGRPLPPGFYHVFYRVLYAFFTPITANAFFTRFLRVFYAFFLS
jgi:hypothetical protein